MSRYSIVQKFAAAFAALLMLAALPGLAQACPQCFSRSTAPAHQHAQTAAPAHCAHSAATTILTSTCARHAPACIASANLQPRALTAISTVAVQLAVYPRWSDAGAFERDASPPPAMSIVPAYPVLRI